MQRNWDLARGRIRWLYFSECMENIIEFAKNFPFLFICIKSKVTLKLVRYINYYRG